MKLSAGLFLLFTALKLTSHITWSWWLVTAPLWAGWALLFVMSFLVVVAGGTKKPKRGW
jgi:hypothetical protein